MVCRVKLLGVYINIYKTTFRTHERSRMPVTHTHTHTRTQNRIWPMSQNANARKNRRIKRGGGGGGRGGWGVTYLILCAAQLDRIVHCSHRALVIFEFVLSFATFGLPSFDFTCIQDPFKLHIMCVIIVFEAQKILPKDQLSSVCVCVCRFVASVSIYIVSYTPSIFCCRYTNSKFNDIYICVRRRTNARHSGKMWKCARLGFGTNAQDMNCFDVCFTSLR